MEHVYTTSYKVTTLHADCFSRCRPSGLLRFAQDAAGEHCQILGTDWDSMAKKNFFWAVIRQRMEITRLPKEGETVTVKTWPMPTTRVAYPRATEGFDAEGNSLFKVMSLWVIMDMDSRAMVLPGKSGVLVDGTLRGNELAVPGSLAIKNLTNSSSRSVLYSDLDRNGHMNNTRYLEWIGDLLPSAFHRNHTPKEFTVCYHSEALEGESLDIHYEMKEDGLLQVDAWRENDASTGNHHRVFVAQVQYETDIL